jgi:anti-sigma regulatory factor (Ser/Thr protein kinase)
MSRTIKDLNKFASEKLGFDVQFAESVEYAPEEVMDILEEVELTENVLVHASGNDDDTITMLITTNFPEYNYIALLIDNGTGEFTHKELFI